MNTVKNKIDKKICFNMKNIFNQITTLRGSLDIIDTVTLIIYARYVYMK